MTKEDARPLSFISDGFRLQGMLHLPAVLPAPFVIGCHGLFADKESPKQIELGQRISDRGAAYLRFDHRGCGQSEGDLGKDTSLDARCQDLTDAVKNLEALPEITRLSGLFGSSMGGTVVLATARQFPKIRRVTLAAPLQSTPVITALKASGDPVIEKMPPRFFEEDLRFDISQKVTGLRDILIFHGEADEVVPVEHGLQIFERCRPPRELMIQKNGDHRMSARHDQERFMQKAVDWLLQPLNV